MKNISRLSSVTICADKILYPFHNRFSDNISYRIILKLLYIMKHRIVTQRIIPIFPLTRQRVLEFKSLHASFRIENHSDLHETVRKSIFNSFLTLKSRIFIIENKKTKEREKVSEKYVYRFLLKICMKITDKICLTNLSLPLSLVTDH